MARYPWLMAAREASQLFLWNTDYLVQRLLVPGGLAQYVGECLVQCFYHPLWGAAVYAVLCLAAQWVTFRLLGWQHRLWSPLAAVVVAVLAIQVYVPLTLTVALLMAAAMMLAMPRQGMTMWGAVLLTMTAGYWLTGPAVAMVLLRCRLKAVPAAAVLLACSIYTSSYVAPYPLRQLARGVDYYWEMHHMGSADEMRCDWQIRQGRWADIVADYADSPAAAIQNAVQVARFHLHHISEQELNRSISLSKGAMHSQAGAFLMSEVCMQIGMAQMSQRAAFEAMEAIPNHNKSGRALRRLVETNLVTGYPQVALKYIGLLRQTMAYRTFALRQLPLARHPALIKEHPYYGPLQNAYKESHDTFF